MFLFLAVAHAADPVVQVAAGDLLWCERSAAGAVTCHGKKAGPSICFTSRVWLNRAQWSSLYRSAFSSQSPPRAIE